LPPPSIGPSSASPRGDRRKAWLTPEQAREYLGLTPKQRERYAPRLPWRYLPERGVRYPVSELDAALEAAVRPETSVVNARCDEKTGADGRDEVAEQGIGKGRK